MRQPQPFSSSVLRLFYHKSANLTAVNDFFTVFRHPAFGLDARRGRPPPRKNGKSAFMRRAAARGSEYFVVWKNHYLTLFL
jgi:hypothetical protein